MRIAVPVVKSGDKILLVPHFGRAPSFAIVDLEGNSYKIVEVFQNPYLAHSHGRGVGIVNELVRKGVNTLVSLGAGYGAYYRLRGTRHKDLLREAPTGQKDDDPTRSNRNVPSWKSRRSHRTRRNRR